MALTDFLSALNPLGQGTPPQALGQTGPTPTLLQQPGMSPSQLASLREYIRQLQTKNVEGVQGPISPKAAPLALGAGAASSLITGLLAGQADKAERAQNLGLQSDITDITSQFGGGGGGAAAGSTATPSTGSTGGGGQATGDLSAGSGMVPMNIAKAAIAENESGGRYGEVGPQVPATRDHPSGHALGKYQVMDYDLPNRLAAAGLPAMNSAEFLRNPEAQERQFEHEFGGLMQKHGNFNDAASVWFSGRPMAQAGNASDGYSTVPQYIAKANRTIARLTGGQQSDVQTTANVVSGAPGSPQPSPLQNPQQVAQLVSGQSQPGGPNYPAMTQALTARLVARGIPVTQAAQAAAQIVEGNIKFQPQLMPPDDSGNIVRKYPNGQMEVVQRGSGQIVPIDDGTGLKQFQHRYTEPITRTTTITPVDAYGKPVGPPTIMGPGGQIMGQNTPDTPPSSGPGSMPAPTPVSAPPSQALPASQVASATQFSSPDVKPGQAAGVDTGAPDVTKAVMTPPPAAQQPQGIPNVEDYAKKPYNAGSFNLPPPPGSDKPVEQRAAWADQRKNIQEANADFLKKDVARYNDRQATIDKNAQHASENLSDLKLLRNIMKDPNLYTGFMSGKVAVLDQIGKQLGVTSGKMASLLQFAEKLGTAGSLEQIEEQGDRGAVRVPTLNLIRQNNFDKNNTREANTAVVELHARMAERAIEQANLAKQFADTNPNHRLNSNFDQFIRDLYAAKPLVSPEEQQNYESLLKGSSAKNASDTDMIEGRTGTDQSGKKWVVRNGKLVPYQGKM